MQSSFTNPHDRLLCRLILCRALSSGSKTLPEDRSPERGLELVLGCQVPAGTILHGKTSSKRTQTFSVCSSISQRCWRHLCHDALQVGACIPSHVPWCSKSRTNS